MLRRLAVTLLAALSLAACAGTVEKELPQTPAAAQPDTHALLTAADATRNDGRFTEAVQIYEQILVADPKSSAAEYGMAESLLGLSRPADARKIFQGLVKDPQYLATAAQGVGLADLALRKREDAAKSLREAVAADPKLWRAYNGLAMLADLERQFDKAAGLYTKAIALNPDSAVLLNNLGYSRLLAGKPDDARDNFQRALALDPDSATIQNNLRLAIAAKGDYAEATRNAPPGQKAIVLNNVGYVALQRGDLTDAKSLLSQAMAASPDYDAVAAKNLDQLSTPNGDAK